MSLTAPQVYQANLFLNGLGRSSVFTLSQVYLVKTVGLDPLQLVLVGTTLEVTAFLFEIPTGILADTVSRRLSVIIGTALIGLGFLIEGSIPLFAAVLLAQVVWGLGWTFTSGAHEAWVTDEVGAAHVAPVLLRGSQSATLGSLLGIPLSVALGSLGLNIPILFGGVLHIATALWLALKMPETQFAPNPNRERQTWGALRQTVVQAAQLVRGQPSLLAFFSIFLFVGLYSEGYDRLWTAHVLENFTLPSIFEITVWFGLIRASGQLLSLGLTELARRKLHISQTNRLVRILQAAYLGMILCLAGFALTGNFAAALVCLLLFNSLRATIGPIQSAWINQYLPSHVRATVLSAASQTDALGQMMGGPVVGLVGSLRSLRAALLTSASMLLPVLPLFERLRSSPNKPGQ